jgi:hypothetical protein
MWLMQTRNQSTGPTEVIKAFISLNFMMIRGLFNHAETVTYYRTIYEHG